MVAVVLNSVPSTANRGRQSNTLRTAAVEAGIGSQGLNPTDQEINREVREVKEIHLFSHSLQIMSEVMREAGLTAPRFWLLYSIETIRDVVKGPKHTHLYLCCFQVQQYFNILCSRHCFYMSTETHFGL